MTYAYLSLGKLFVPTGEAPARQIESRYAEEAAQRALETHQKRAWKTEGRGGQFMSGAMLWGNDGVDPSALRIHISGVARGTHDNELMFVLSSR